MALLKVLILLSVVFMLSPLPLNSQTTPLKPEAFTFPIHKDPTTNQYYTTISIGSNSTTFNVVLDLGGKFLWFNSLDYFNSASTYRPISCGTRLCTLANGVGCVFCFLSPPVPGCTNNTCSDDALNPFSGTQVYSGLGTDTLHVQSTRGAHYQAPDFPFQFSYRTQSDGLAGPTAGLVGMGRTRISLHAQLASTFGIRREFALCLPSSRETGGMVMGRAAFRGPFCNISLFTTPLVRNPVPTDMNDEIGNLTAEYFVGLESIRVGGRTLRLNQTLLSIDRRTGAGGTDLRTVRPYTALERSIYRALVNEFVRGAKSMGAPKVGAVAPFGACFDSGTIRESGTGPQVPIIDLVMQGGGVYWRLYGWNSMVRVGGNVVCLAFVQGRINPTGPTTSVVVGGYQMENHLLKFDLENSRLGFSSALALHGTSCSDFGAA
ncbi:Eukaryotic aspartyl protease family protein [Striga hermonthica]|uniref:Eukaryotic aspartyl protease family protein n=1 Tax=Striga hermonthica TaxID=68872 RepID=A0A9N7NW62_STRHE|nr:Eukaryotic aspartyl protease family protein [Striga hermonthica]